MVRQRQWFYLHAGILFVGTVCFVSSLWQSWRSNLGPCMCLEQHWGPLVNVNTRATAPALETYSFCILVAQYSWQEANWLWADLCNPDPISLICTSLLNPASSFDYGRLYLMWDEGLLWSSVPSISISKPPWVKLPKAMPRGIYTTLALSTGFWKRLWNSSSFPYSFKIVHLLILFSHLRINFRDSVPVSMKNSDGTLTELCWTYRLIWVWSW